MVDGSDFPKQGVHSVGVKRQYCGELASAPTAKPGVFVGYVSSQGDTMLDRRLYVPAAWLTDDAYTERRRQCGLPADLTFKTKPELAQEMRAAVVQSHALRCQWVVADEAFGGTRLCWMGWWGWACGTLPGWPILHGSGQNVPPSTCRPGGGADAAPSGHVWWRAGPRANSTGDGLGLARRGVDTPDDQGRRPRAYGGGLCCPAGGRRTGCLARS